jgi:hypothetical protein
MRNWRLNTVAWDDALDFSDLKLPIVVKHVNRVGPHDGSYYFRYDTVSDRMYHLITIKGYLKPAEAGLTLWHELCHAMQAERETAEAANMREALNMWENYLAADNGVRYFERSSEIEAYEYEKFNGEIPLALPRRRGESKLSSICYSSVPTKAAKARGLRRNNAR